MPPKNNGTAPAPIAVSKKRKANSQVTPSSRDTSGRKHDPKRVKVLDARVILTQTNDAALKNGELDVQSFLKSREFEIKALEDGMRRSKKGLSTRAFQEVPRDMRRRTASHNVKRVPRRMQNRAAREMREDNTPTVKRSKRKPGSSRGRVRAETAKRLGILAANKKASKGEDSARQDTIETRPARPKLRRDKLNDPPKPKSKFRKRQIHKTWLPTHMWLAKRATMTEPKNPLWRFALPITSTEKSYRPTHRASGASGAVAWDMSYMSTIGLEGNEASLEKLLRLVGVVEESLWTEKGMKWRNGKRSWNGWLTREVKDKSVPIGPATLLWCPTDQDAQGDKISEKAKKPPVKKIFIRIHPSAFLEAWNELLRLSKLQRPKVHIEDLRFEIGSIDITGPGSTETLLGILHPYYASEDIKNEHAETFKSLAGVTNPSSLPLNSLLSFSILDPRLHYPPRAVKLPKASDEDANFALLETISAWPVDHSTGSPALFDRDARFKATRLPAQKSLNRRKALAPPGQYPSIRSTDPPIPIVLLTSRLGASGSMQGTWTLLAPWKCILPIWYGLMHYPLSSGRNPRFGGIRELRQIHFEHGVPWFPADFPGTQAGFDWEANERERRKSEWDKRPKGKRTEWSSVDLGGGRKGELGQGWACDFEYIVDSPPPSDIPSSMDTTQDIKATVEAVPKVLTTPIQYILASAFNRLISSPTNDTLPPPSAVATIRITLIGRGVATPCARIYRLPQELSPDSLNTSDRPLVLRSAWLALLPPSSHIKAPPNPKTIKHPSRIPLNLPLPQRVRLLAQSLLYPPLPYLAEKDSGEGPLVPDEEDLIGFVTTGEFNLAEGKGVAVGTVVVEKVLDALKWGKRGDGAARLCIVRNAGERIGRLAKWQAV
jgi:ribonuclease P/MRP protein subunit POP1